MTIDGSNHQRAAEELLMVTGTLPGRQVEKGKRLFIREELTAVPTAKHYMDATNCRIQIPSYSSMNNCLSPKCNASLQIKVGEMRHCSVAAPRKLVSSQNPGMGVGRRAKITIR